MKKMFLFLLLILLLACSDPVYPQITFDRVVQIRDNYYLDSGQGTIIDSSMFTNVSVWRTYSFTWVTTTYYLDQKLDLRWYPDTTIASPLGDSIGTLRIYEGYDLVPFITYLDTAHADELSNYAYDFSLIEQYYVDFVADGGDISIFKVYLNYESQWWSGTDGPKTLYYNSEWLQFVPAGSTYVDTADNNFNMVYLGDLGIKETGPISVEGWFQYFDSHKYDNL